MTSPGGRAQPHPGRPEADRASGSAGRTTRSCRAWRADWALLTRVCDDAHGTRGLDAPGSAGRMPRRSGAPLVDAALPFREAHFWPASHADRIPLRADWSAVGPEWQRMPRLPASWSHRARPRRSPFRLVTAPARRFLNTSFTETPGSRRRKASDGVDPSGRCRSAGSRTETESNWATTRIVTVHAQAVSTASCQHASSSRASGRLRIRGRRRINTLVGDDPIPPYGGGGHDTQSG